MVRSTATAPWRENIAIVTTASANMASGSRGMEEGAVGVERDTKI